MSLHDALRRAYAPPPRPSAEPPESTLARDLAAIVRPLTAGRRPPPPPDRVMRVCVEVEVDVPVWITEDRDDGISVELAPVKDWRVAPVEAQLEQYIRKTFEDELEDRARVEFESRCDGGYEGC